ncbi:unnamed protein product, partial [Iphiclides podalirius]
MANGAVRTANAQLAGSHCSKTLPYMPEPPGTRGRATLSTIIWGVRTITRRAGPVRVGGLPEPLSLISRVHRGQARLVWVPRDVGWDPLHSKIIRFLRLSNFF